MSSRAATFTQSDIKRALTPAVQLGLVVAGYEIDPEGRIIVRTIDGGDPRPVKNDWDDE